MAAVPAKCRIRVVDEYERVAHETLEVDEMADVPLVRSAVGCLARELCDHRFGRWLARPKPARADIRDQLRITLRREQSRDALRRPRTPQRNALRAGCLDRFEQPMRGRAGLL